MRLRREKVVVAEPPVVVTDSAQPGRMRMFASRARTAAVPWRTSVEPVAPESRFRIGPRVQQAKERVVPAAELAAERTRQRLMEDLVPQVTAAVTAAVAASEPYLTEAQRRSRAAAEALRGAAEVEPAPEKKTHRIRRLLMLLGLGGAAAAAYKWWSGGDSESEWQQAYEPAPAQPQSGPVSAVPSTEETTSTSPADPSDPLATSDTVADVGAASPDEALADSTEVPHEPTAPDDPLEERDVPPGDSRGV